MGRGRVPRSRDRWPSRATHRARRLRPPAGRSRPPRPRAPRPVLPATPGRPRRRRSPMGSRAGHSGFSRERAQGVPVGTVDPRGAEFDGRSERLAGVDAPTDAIAGLHDLVRNRLLRQDPCCRQAGRARPDDEHALLRPDGGRDELGRAAARRQCAMHGGGKVRIGRLSRKDDPLPIGSASTARSAGAAPTARYE